MTVFAACRSVILLKYEMRRLLQESVPKELYHGQWHMPLLPDLEQLGADGFTGEDLIKISIGRCARVSYLTHDSVRDPREDIALFQRLLQSGHMSPFEHVAEALGVQEWKRVARAMAEDWVEKRIPVGNFWGFHQYRKCLPREHDFSLRDAIG